MMHTIISWDCSFRNFFHLIDALLNQEYDRNEFELIYVEQRTRKVADDFNHSLGLKSLWDRYQEVKNSFNLRVIYLNAPQGFPYHLGRSNNKAIEEARGEIISVMDGDILVPSNFLSKLEEFHRRQGTAIVNLARHMCSRPVGVDNVHWTEQTIDYDLCLNVCPSKNDPIPRSVENKGPLISAKRRYWVAVGGYDEHIIWSTGISRLGLDVTARLEILTGVKSKALPNCSSVHPWHPQGFDRKRLNSQKMLNLHTKLIKWAQYNNESHWKNRREYTEKLYRMNKRFVDKMIYSDLKQPGIQNIDTSNIMVKFSRFIVTTYRKIKNVGRGFLNLD